ncbi:MAG: STAS domain-containing protein [Gammaproteobacteria bacterium]
MKQRKPARKTGNTRRIAKASAPKRKSDRPVALPAECVIASAPGLRTTLLKRVGDAGNVRIDASAVQRIDTASLQVLAAFARDRRADGLPLEWLGVPDCLTEAATLLDLTTALGFANPGSGSSVRA